MNEIKIDAVATNVGEIELTEEMKKKIILHKIELENKKIRNTWESCCIKLDRRAVQYFTQIFIMTGIMAFSVGMLFKNETCEAQQAYLGLLTLMVGLIIPNPKFKDGSTD